VYILAEMRWVEERDKKVRVAKRSSSQIPDETAENYAPLPCFLVSASGASNASNGSCLYAASNASQVLLARPQETYIYTVEGIEPSGAHDHAAQKKSIRRSKDQARPLHH
jgi:hypothetical protein